MEISELESKIGYRFSNKDLLRLALTHSSYKNENHNVGGDNERLEFLGDSVISLITSEWLFKKFKSKNEGELSKIRASLVYGKSLAEYAEKIDLGSYLYIGKGEGLNGGKKRPSNLEDAFEALTGAIYLDGGLKRAKEFVMPFLSSHKDLTPDSMHDYKSTLMEEAQKMGYSDIDYVLVEQTGPSHDTTFLFSVKINGRVFGKGMGKSKKAAQQEASKEALERLNKADKIC